MVDEILTVSVKLKRSEMDVMRTMTGVDANSSALLAMARQGMWLFSKMRLLVGDSAEQIENDGSSSGSSGHAGCKGGDASGPSSSVDGSGNTMENYASYHRKIDRKMLDAYFRNMEASQARVPQDVQDRFWEFIVAGNFRNSAGKVLTYNNLHSTYRAWRSIQDREERRMNESRDIARTRETERENIASVITRDVVED